MEKYLIIVEKIVRINENFVADDCNEDSTLARVVDIRVTTLTLNFISSVLAL